MDMIDGWKISNQEKIDYFLNFFRHFDKESPFIDESNVEWTEDYLGNYEFISEGFKHVESKQNHGIH